MPKKTLLKTLEIEVTEESGCITIRRRVLFYFLMGSGGLAASAFFYFGVPFLGGLINDSRFVALGRWGGVAIAGVSALVPPLALRVLFERPKVVDSVRGTLSIGNRVVQLHRAKNPHVRRISLGSVDSYVLWVEVDGREENLIKGVMPKYEKTLTEIAARIAGMLQSQVAAADPARDARRSEDFYRLLIGAVLIGLGIVWSASGFFFMRNFVFIGRSSSSSFGFLFWPFGIWIAALGALTLAKIPLYRNISEGPLWKRVLWGFVWLSSYFLICFRSY